MRMRFQLAAVALSCSLCGCHQHAEISVDAGTATQPKPGRTQVVAAESVYADIAAQIGAGDVVVHALQHGVDADPHAYEPTSADAELVENAGIVIQNGAGYDAFVQKLLDASPSDDRTVVDVSALVHLARGGNPHVWYDIDADRALGEVLAADLERLLPSERTAIAARARRFEASLDRWDAQLRGLKADAGGAKVATTEPVFDDVLERAGIGDVTPHSFALAIEDGNDPAPQDVATLDAFVPSGVRALVVNAQTVEPATSRLVARARAANLPVVSVTESLPDGEHLQGWLERETRALALAVARPAATRRS